MLEEFQRLLSDPDIQLQTHRVELGPALDRQALSIPKTSVYLIDGGGSARATEALIQELRDSYPEARLLVAADGFDEANAFTLLRLGVRGILKYQQLGEQLERALEAVAAGGYWVPRLVLARFVESMIQKRSPQHEHSFAKLSSREKEIGKMLLENLSNKEIANKLNISERTVKFHVSNLLAKFGVRRRADLMLLCLFQTSGSTSEPLLSPGPLSVDKAKA